MSTEAVRRPGPSLRLSLGIVALALAIGIPCGFVAIRAFVRLVDAPSRATPGRITLDAKRGTYAVYERTGTRGGIGNVTFSTDSGPVLGPSDVAVTGPDGDDIETRVAGSVSETITRAGVVYTASVRFDVPSAGRYTVVVSGEPTRVLVTRTLGSTFGSVAGYVAGAGAAFVALLTGVVLWIVGVVRRRNVAPPGPPGPYVPMPAVAPGWYPDPTDPRWWRYHDGRGWTPHTAPRQT